MKPRCQGAKTPGHWTGFECVLDDGHDGFCEPCQAPSVDEWRKLKHSAEMHKRVAAMRADDCQGWSEENITLRADLALYQAEAKTLRDKLESGDIEAPWRAEVVRLQAENDALRASIGPEHFTCPDCGPHQKSDEDGCCATCGADLGIFPCDDCAHGTPKHPASQEATLAEMRGALDDDEPERTDP